MICISQEDFFNSEMSKPFKDNRFHDLCLGSDECQAIIDAMKSSNVTHVLYEFFLMKS